MSEDQSSFKTLQRSKKIIFNFFLHVPVQTIYSDQYNLKFTEHDFEILEWTCWPWPLWSWQQLKSADNRQTSYPINELLLHAHFYIPYSRSNTLLFLIIIIGQVEGRPHKRKEREDIQRQPKENMQQGRELYEEEWERKEGRKR